MESKKFLESRTKDLLTSIERFKEILDKEQEAKKGLFKLLSQTNDDDAIDIIQNNIELCCSKIRFLENTISCVTSLFSSIDDILRQGAWLGDPAPSKENFQKLSDYQKRHLLNGFNSAMNHLF